MSYVIGVLLDFPVMFFYIIVPLILFVIVLLTSKKFKSAAWYLFGWLGVAFLFHSTGLIDMIPMKNMDKFYAEIYAKEPKCFAEIFERRTARAIEDKTIGSSFIDKERLGKLYRDYILDDIKQRYRSVYGEKEFVKCTNQKPKARGSKTLKGK